ncbi:Zinc transporter like [Fagus crenata]
MGHSISPAPSLPTPISTRLKRTQFPSLGFQRVWACHQGCNEDQHDKLVRRRAVTLGLAGAMLSLNVGDQRASAAARRPPPPPPGERKDPNVSGVQAKVLASKKRKEAMKEEVAKLRERGKTIKEPTE